MNYHDIKHDDMNNGSGLRVTLFVSGCDHYCPECHNQETWDTNSGIPFDEAAKNEIFDQLSKDYISGITFSGGDPLNKHNVEYVYSLISEIKERFPNKSIWLYTGYTWEELWEAWSYCNISVETKYRIKAIRLCDVLVDGVFDIDKADVNYHWAGSTNQRVIDVQKSLKVGDIVLYENHCN
jgi:anaerobic ribonucleoside-triphosphate reductase activating protein